MHSNLNNKNTNSPSKMNKKYFTYLIAILISTSLPNTIANSINPSYSRKIKRNNKINDNQPPFIFKNFFEGENFKFKPLIARQTKPNQPLQYFVKWDFQPDDNRSVNGSSFSCGYTKMRDVIVSQNDQFEVCSQALNREVNINKINGELIVDNLLVAKDSGNYTYTYFDIINRETYVKSIIIQVKKQPPPPVIPRAVIPLTPTNIILASGAILIPCIIIVFLICCFYKKKQFHKNIQRDRENILSRKRNSGHGNGRSPGRGNSNKNITKADISLPAISTLKTTHDDQHDIKIDVRCNQESKQVVPGQNTQSSLNSSSNQPMAQNQNQLLVNHHNTLTRNARTNEELCNSNDEQLPLISASNNRNPDHHVKSSVIASNSLNSGNEHIDLPIISNTKLNAHLNSSANENYSHGLYDEKTVQLLQNSKIRSEQADKLMAEVDHFLSDRESSSLALGTSATSNPPSINGHQNPYILNQHSKNLHTIEVNQQHLTPDSKTRHVPTASKLESELIDKDVRESLLLAAKNSTLKRNVCPNSGLTPLSGLHAQSLNHFNLAQQKQQQQQMHNSVMVLGAHRSTSQQSSSRNTNTTNTNSKLPPSYEEALAAKRRRQELESQLNIQNSSVFTLQNPLPSSSQNTSSNTNDRQTSQGTNSSGIVVGDYLSNSHSHTLPNRRIKPQLKVSEPKESNTTTSLISPTSEQNSGLIDAKNIDNSHVIHVQERSMDYL